MASFSTACCNCGENPVQDGIHKTGTMDNPVNKNMPITAMCAQTDCSKISFQLKDKKDNELANSELAHSLKAGGFPDLQIRIAPGSVRDYELFDGTETRVDTLSVGRDEGL